MHSYSTKNTKIIAYIWNVITTFTFTGEIFCENYFNYSCSNSLASSIVSKSSLLQLGHLEIWLIPAHFENTLPHDLQASKSLKETIGNNWTAR